jgi:hypothetical protein
MHRYLLAGSFIQPALPPRAAGQRRVSGVADSTRPSFAGLRT